MFRKAIKSGTLLTAQMLGEKEDTSPLISECITRKMTPEEWEKYGPLNINDSKIMKKSKSIYRDLSQSRP